MFAGLLLSQSKGDGSYTQREGHDRPTVESTQTRIYPYTRFDLSERVSAWDRRERSYESASCLHPQCDRVQDTRLHGRTRRLGIRTPRRPEAQRLETPRRRPDGAGCVPRRGRNQRAPRGRKLIEAPDGGNALASRSVEGEQTYSAQSSITLTRRLKRLERA